MKQQIIKIIINIKTILLLIIVTTSCALSIPGTKIHDQEMQAIYDMTSSIKPSNSDGQDPYDVNDLSGCMVLTKLSKWKEEENKWGKWWSRRDEWRRRSWVKSTGNSIRDYNESKKLHKAVINDNHKYIYIGPWEYSKIIGKEIRFFATQQNDIIIDHGFESINDYNKNIRQKSFSLDKNFVLPTRDDICKVKWMAKFGYNTIAETHYPGFLNSILKTDIQLTGKLIELEN